MPYKDWLVSRWMSKSLYTVGKKDPVVDALELMGERRIRHVPVVDGKKLVGIISDRDVRAFYPSRKSLGEAKDYSERIMTTPCGEMMAKKPITTSPQASLREAAEVLCREKIGALPVVEDDALVGIITAEDVLWAFVDNFDDLRDLADS